MSDPVVPPSSTRRRLATALTLFLVCAGMVYGTWLAVDDMRAKPMAAQVTVDAGRLMVVNDGDFTWTDAVFTINGVFSTGAPDALAPGATLVLPLDAFADANGRRLSWPADHVRDVTARATRRSRFGAFNTDRPTTGRWPIDQPR